MDILAAEVDPVGLSANWSEMMDSISPQSSLIQHS